MQKAIWIFKKNGNENVQYLYLNLYQNFKNSISTKRPTSANAEFVLEQHSLCSKKTRDSYSKKKILLKLPAKEDIAGLYNAEGNWTGLNLACEFNIGLYNILTIVSWRLEVESIA